MMDGSADFAEVSAAWATKMAALGIVPRDDGTISKSELAKLHDRSPAAVTKWIKAGTLSGAALKGGSRSARIVLTEAERQLTDNLDPAQQMAQEQPIARDAAAVAVETEADPPAEPAGPTAEQSYAWARARKMEADAILAEARVQKQAGIYVLADDVRRETGRLIADLTDRLERLPQALGETIAAEFGVDQRAVTIAIRQAVRRERELWTAALEAAADAGGED